MLLSWDTSHCKIFSADADVRLARRMRRDMVDKHRDIGAVFDQVCNVMFLCYQSYGEKKNHVIEVIGVCRFKVSRHAVNLQFWGQS